MTNRWYRKKEKDNYRLTQEQMEIIMIACKRVYNYFTKNNESLAFFDASDDHDTTIANKMKVSKTTQDREYFNDEHYVLKFGKFKGKRLCDCDHGYLNWLVNEGATNDVGREAINALIRISKRKAVTVLLRDVKNRFSCPRLVEIGNFAPIERPNGISPQFFGTFFELLVKYWKGIKQFDCAITRLSTCGLIKSRLNAVREPTNYDVFYKRAYDAVMNEPDTPLQILNILVIADPTASLHSFNADREIIEKNIDYFTSYRDIATRVVPKFNEVENLRNDQISVGCVIGTLDAISHGVIYEFKVCQVDALEEWSMQLWTYGCLHRLRYGTDVLGIKAVNYLTGKIFYVEDSWANINAEMHISRLGHHCAEHIALFTK